MKFFFPKKLLSDFLLSLPLAVKKLCIIFVDVICCFLASWLAFYLRLGEFIYLDWVFGIPSILSIAVLIPLFSYSGFYNLIFHLSGVAVLRATFVVMIIYGLIFSFVFTVVGVEGVPRTIGLIQPLLLSFFVSGSRIFAWVLFEEGHWLSRRRERQLKVLIYGAGVAGRQIAGLLGHEKDTKVFGFIDDNPDTWGRTVDMINIYPSSALYKLLSANEINQVYLAIPSLSLARRREILELLSNHSVAVRVLPQVEELEGQTITFSDTQELVIEDLLGRPPVEPNNDLVRKNIEGQVVMVTGAGGSIGGEICRLVLDSKPAALILIDKSEFALYSICEHLVGLKEAHNQDFEIQLIPLLGCVADSERISQIMEAWSIDTIYHAAAYKHVSLVEHNPIEAIKNNVFGTYTVAKAAIDSGVSNFVLISTDKAVRPTSVMGATKRMAEMILQSLQGVSGNVTRFSIVRFGNVLGSSGSVIPKFRSQLASGGPITVTHPEVTRFFMTIREAALLVIQAGAMAKGGEVFVLDMGDPVKILDLARKMIHLANLKEKNDENPAGDIAIEFSGLRPGEKLYEELLIAEGTVCTDHPKILTAFEQYPEWPEVVAQLDNLRRAIDENNMVLCSDLLSEYVEGYHSSGELFDLVYRKKKSA